MKSINLFLLTRNINGKDIFLYEGLLSAREEEIRHRMDEVELLKTLVSYLVRFRDPMKKMDGFFYSFTIPQISKEFDLLKIGKNGVVVNIELKSQMVALERIEKQLKQNRYYLNSIATDIYSFTLVHDNGQSRLYVYDTELRECTFEELENALSQIDEFVEEGIENLFKPKDYLISPLNTPDKFIGGKYYLTTQQEEIKREILRSINGGDKRIWGITGTAGTGKTLLLYDIAKEQSRLGRTCIIHCGLFSEGHTQLQGKIDNLDLIEAKAVNLESIRQYRYIFVDESQRIYENACKLILDVSRMENASCVFSYDYYQTLSYAEENRNIPEMLRQELGFVERSLTDKIRTNKEVASFIRNMINLNDKPQKQINYKNIEVIYANDYYEAGEIIKYYSTVKDYTFIGYTPSRFNCSSIDYFSRYINTHRVIGQEFDNVIFSMDDNFRYSEDGHLQGKEHPNPDYKFYKLWYQGVSRAREKLCILVIGNQELFSSILAIKKNDATLMQK